jgi:hypothetical protein
MAPRQEAIKEPKKAGITRFLIFLFITLEWIVCFLLSRNKA